MRLTVSAVVSALPLAAAAQHDALVPEETVARINEVLTTMQCQIDPHDSWTTDAGGYEFDDVMCSPRKPTTELDANLQETERRAE